MTISAPADTLLRLLVIGIDGRPVVPPRILLTSVHSEMDARGWVFVAGVWRIVTGSAEILLVAHPAANRTGPLIAASVVDCACDQQRGSGIEIDGVVGLNGLDCQRAANIG